MIKPQDFSGEEPPERIIGTECEYNIQAREGSSAGSYVTASAISRAGFGSYGTTEYSRFLDNGGNVGQDMSHIEYRSAEARGPRQAAAADLAGPILLDKILNAGKIPHRGVYRFTGSFIPGAGQNEETNGYHENYLISRDLEQSPWVDIILPTFLASRIWASSGALRDTYVLGQKVWGIGSDPITRGLARRTSHGTKPMATIPNKKQDLDVLGDTDAWARIEVRFADALMSPTARFLGLAATSLMIRLIEHPDLIDQTKLRHTALRNPNGAARMFANDLTLKRTTVTNEGKNYTWVNLQEELALAAKALSRLVKLPDDEVLAIQLWLGVCDRLRLSKPDQGDWGSLTHTLDVAAKHAYLLRKHTAEELYAGNDEAAQRSAFWDRVVPKGGSQAWWDAHPSKVVTPEAIAQRVTSPPPDTRAAARAAHIRRKTYNKISHMSWSVVVREQSGQRRLRDLYRSDP